MPEGLEFGVVSEEEELIEYLMNKYFDTLSDKELKDLDARLKA